MSVAGSLSRQQRHQNTRSPAGTCLAFLAFLALLALLASRFFLLGLHFVGQPQAFRSVDAASGSRVEQARANVCTEQGHAIQVQAK